ncbi:Leucine carboxyl methyltransferase [Rosistilla carotiformis]|uniref:Leucine carboxyl methyltransferase n=1 Tax=Rosistilla carotiformis TaxID=2528017 RepID=A0A518JQY2_9BACT|nr:SAM-dependent methyltransferase [Rosistilla carotiformis]QDV67944.1 Leucine carboxyl methyltransferase [Rosistilla carotiformis]
MVGSQVGHAAISWQQDYADRMNPTLVTGLLHEAVPALKSIDWRITEVREGMCVTELPLCYASTNQHGTHQAALISLSADYTGGIALASLLRAVPIVGVHPCHEDDSASLWLASMDVKYRIPSTGHLRGVCEVPESLVNKVRQRYFAGKRVLVTLPVTFTANGDVVAEAEMKYFAQPSIQLRPTKEQPQISPLYKHKLKSSARMIAGLRASSQHEHLRLDAGHERQAAGPHGELLAMRLCRVLPQLQDMVLARTAHIDQTITDVENLQQVVILGAGLDMRPFRLFAGDRKPIYFELDLPEMLEERTRVISQMKDRPDVRRRMVGADFKQDDVARLLLEHPDFDPQLPTVVVYEGCSMYFSKAENRRILNAASEWLGHRDSRIWCDFVTQGVVDGTSQHPAVAKFLEGMEELGERFIFGCDRPAELLRQCGFATTETTPSGQHLRSTDPLLSEYQFAVSTGVRPTKPR